MGFLCPSVGDVKASQRLQGAMEGLTDVSHSVSPEQLLLVYSSAEFSFSFDH